MAVTDQKQSTFEGRAWWELENSSDSKEVDGPDGVKLSYFVWVGSNENPGLA
jgi:hypothetical protein